jgi:hypothetical protein
MICFPIKATPFITPSSAIKKLMPADPSECFNVGLGKKGQCKMEKWVACRIENYEVNV